MIIPWGTDAPIYHRPIATIALIVLNVLAFFLVPARAHEDWTLVSRRRPPPGSVADQHLPARRGSSTWSAT